MTLFSPCRARCVRRPGSHPALLLLVHLVGVATAVARVPADFEALSAYRDGRYPDAEARWRRLAEDGADTGAMLWFGVMAAEGLGRAEGAGTALSWFQRAAEQDHPLALFNLGVLYWKGELVGRDRSFAVALWRRAAEFDLAEAQFNVAAAYLRGEGVGRDTRKARTWLVRATQQGHEDAAVALRAMEAAGHGAPRRETRRALPDGEDSQPAVVDSFGSGGRLVVRGFLTLFAAPGENARHAM